MIGYRFLKVNTQAYKPRYVSLNSVSKGFFSTTRCTYAYKKQQKNNYTKRVQKKPLDFVIPPFITLSNLATLMKVKYDYLIKKMISLKFGNNLSGKYILTREYIELILEEFNYDLKNEDLNIRSSENIYEELRDPVQPNYLKPRPPIITIMGHVDHGKTTLLDYLRRTDVVSGEHGGITQHIGAFKVITPVTKSTLTFLDTPGHSAFLKMRERGAKTTDIVVLVVDCDDLIMEQTKEAINHIKNNVELQTPENPDVTSRLVVAMSKIDKISDKRLRSKKIDDLKLQLSNLGIPMEGMGGDVPVVPISAKTGENMELLEENLVLLGEVLDLKAENSSTQMSEGIIIESNKDSKKGIMATALVKRGILKTSSVIICGNTYCRIRRMDDDKNNMVKTAAPADVVQIFGWKDVPVVGDMFIQVKHEKIAKKYTTERINLINEENEAAAISDVNEKNFINQEKKRIEKRDKHKSYNDSYYQNEDAQEVEDGPVKCNYIIKGDVLGSVEAIKDCLLPMKNNEVECKIISQSVGNPTISDFELAKTFNASIICFNLNNDAEIDNLCKSYPEIQIKKHNVIYHLLEEITEDLTNNLKPIFEDKEVFKVNILKELSFKVKNKQIKVAGCKVSDGLFKKSSLVSVKRNSPNGLVEVFSGKILTLKRNADDAKEVNKGVECACTFENFTDFKEGDIIVGIEKTPIQRHFIPA
ncbi:related to Translation initiation factor IF-2, mitochondrial [Hanseniaspora guilliermondii]|uniref:Translation initiation factor IF-2, mitochondrial n=1 Tax=Hanseniaspora guilliermondii TaxID=56406 RepID=A0A1L0AZA4_9ASCO|nr:related to Translation initiation factor IF-2, mitochondrial [Hanseniaspora guilliermondii]